MSDKTHIEWTDATWNPVTGCSKVSQGCKHCYAERDWKRLAANPVTVYYQRDFTNVQTHPDRIDQPLRWKKPRRIFVNSMSDLFHDDIPDRFIADAFGVMAAAAHHQFQLLTKRPLRMARLLDDATFQDWAEDCHDLYNHKAFAWPPSNVWIGVSVEDQATADERIPLLLDTPAAVRWISAEPLLGPIDLTRWAELGGLDTDLGLSNPGLDWVVAGGESGPKARPSHPDWFRTLRNQCTDAHVPFLFKQWGEWAPSKTLAAGTELPFKHWAWISENGGQADQTTGPFKDEYAHHELMGSVGKRSAGRELDGRTWDQYPEVSP